MSLSLRAYVLGLALATAAAPVALAQSLAPASATPFQATTLELAAHGDAKAAPDQATIQVGVQTDAPTAAQALQANADQMARVISALKRSGLSDRDLQTAQLSLNPQYDYQQNQPPKLRGYQASNQLSITTRDLKRLGPTIDAAVAAGATNVNSISFSLQDPTAAEDAARLAAVKALQAKAELYAKATGYRVARLVTLGEGVAGAPRPPVPLVFAAAKRMEAAETVVSPGEMEVRVDISGVYELTR